MGEFVRNAWYIAGWADEVGSDKPLGRTIAGTKIVMFRDGQGALCALRDRCSHRLVPLSMGTICKGVLECGYHGLQFDGTGTCVSNPHGPVSRSLSVESFTLTERFDLLWLWLGDRAKADPATIPDMSASPHDPDRSSFRGYMGVRCNHLLLVDNLLDLSHADYLHKGGLNSGGTMTKLRPRVEESANAVLAEWFVSKDDKGVAIMRTELPDPTALVDMWTEVKWHVGGAVMLKVGMVTAGESREKGVVTHVIHAMTPETAVSSHYFYRAWRNYKVGNAQFEAGMREAVRFAFEDEDKVMLEAQQAAVGSDDFMSHKPALLAIDTASSRVRRLHERLLAAERQDGVLAKEA